MGLLPHDPEQLAQITATALLGHVEVVGDDDARPVWGDYDKALNLLRPYTGCHAALQELIERGDVKEEDLDSLVESYIERNK